MKDDIHKILHELYEIDPELKAHETTLMRMISELKAHQPTTIINKAFVKRLRKQLVEQTITETSMQTSFTSRWLYAFAGAIATVVFMVPISLYFLAGTGPMSVTPTAMGTVINRLGAEAFGSLAAVSSTETAAPTPMGGFAEDKLSSRIMSGGGGAAMGDAMIVPPEPYTVYQYEYTGDLDLSEVPTTVYQRVKGATATSALAGTLGRFTMGLVDASRFDNLSVNNFTLTQDQDKGFMISVDFRESMVSIFQNWNTWVYEDRPQVTQGNFPPDDQIIALANQFVARYGVDMSAYGEPMVDNAWRTYAELARARGEEVYVPQEVSVRYPLVIEGEQIYEQWGEVYGLYVNVSLTENQAVSMYNHIAPQFNASEYALMSDEARLLQTITNGGSLYPYDYTQDPLVTIETLTLGEPELIYMHYQQWNGQTNQDLFVPAWRFPVTERPANNEWFNQQYVTVPLVQDLYDAIDEQPRPLPVEPLILEDGAVEGGVSTLPAEAGEVSITSDFGSKLVYDYASGESAAAQDCAERGGTFNSCGSSCAPDAEICTKECALVCEL